MTESVSKQHLRALELANAVRSRRRELLDPIRRGTVLFAELDLDEPALQSMTIYSLIRNVRIKRATSPQARATGGTAWTARRVIRAFRCSPTAELGSFSPARKRELKTVVAAVIPAQRPA